MSGGLARPNIATLGHSAVSLAQRQRKGMFMELRGEELRDPQRVRAWIFTSGQKNSSPNWEVQEDCSICFWLIINRWSCNRGDFGDSKSFRVLSVVFWAFRTASIQMLVALAKRCSGRWKCIMESHLSTCIAQVSHVGSRVSLPEFKMCHCHLAMSHWVAQALWTSVYPFEKSCYHWYWHWYWYYQLHRIVVPSTWYILLIVSTYWMLTNTCN